MKGRWQCCITQNSQFSGSWCCSRVAYVYINKKTKTIKTKQLLFLVNSWKKNIKQKTTDDDNDNDVDHDDRDNVDDVSVFLVS